MAESLLTNTLMVKYPIHTCLSRSDLRSIKERIQKVKIKHRKERQVYNGFDPEFYGFL
ncbi:MAG: hypothetical protein JRN52_00915 [Nitrososphaerota archaeon]|nr:hypothetical protein [Nitrososphaerota archaeon]